MSNAQHNLKVGDRLAFHTNNSMTGHHWQIYPITKITPSGRIKCGSYELNPDLTIRTQDIWLRTTCHLLTDNIRREWRRERLVSRMRTTKWAELTDDQLFRVSAIVNEPKGE